MKKFALILVIALLGIAAAAQANKFKNVVYAEKDVRATHTVKTFTFPAHRGDVYVTVWAGKYEVAQSFITEDGCNGTYDDFSLGVHVFVELPKCDGVTDSPFRVSYVSTKKPRKLNVKYSSSPIFR